MTTVKFVKSVKYNGVRHAAHESFKVANEDVAQLKEAGAIVLDTDAETPSAPLVHTGEAVESHNDEDVAQLKEELLKYTVSQLTQVANERGIDLQGKTRKADIYNIIVSALN